MESVPATGSPAAASTGSHQVTTGYKLVKVRKPDGAIVTVKRKLSPGEATAAPAPVQDSTTCTTVSSPAVETRQFKIVTVRKDDGTLVKVRRLVDKQSEDAEKKQTAGKDADSRDLKSTNTATEMKSTTDKPNPTTKTGTPATKGTEGAKVANVVGPGAVSVADKPKFVDGSPNGKPNERELADALAEQAIYNKGRRSHRFKSSLLSGFGMALGAALPSLELSHNFEDGDEILSDDDDDYSVDDDDHGRGSGADDDHDVGHDMSDDLQARHAVDDGTGREVENSASGTHVTFDAGAAVGGLAAAAAANAAAQPPPPPPAAQAGARAPQNGGTSKADPEKERHTYKITAQELSDLEKAAAEKVTEKKLHRHWANFSFYFMASLSIILPSLFILLTGFIGGMNGKLVGSSWSKMEDPIKIAVSAWPIVFAAVVAQCFKAWATFKVERGIKLMELEQLVGSSSFASAIKQPVLLRRLDLLTLALFAVWCLSPIGSQALLRVYTLDRQQVNTTATVNLVPNYGPNRLFTSSNNTVFWKEPLYSELLQLVSTYYVAAMTPDGTNEEPTSDVYLHPIMLARGGPDLGLGWNAQAYGAMLTYPLSVLRNDLGEDDDLSSTKTSVASPKSETLNFKVPYSYFNFTCAPWQIKKRKEVEGDEEGLVNWSESGTFAMDFTPSKLSENFTGFTGIRLASAKNVPRPKNGSHNGNSAEPPLKPWEDQEYPHSYIECGFTQVFEEGEVQCQTDLRTRMPNCNASQHAPMPAERTAGMETVFADMAWDFVLSGNPAVTGFPVTLAEIYLLTGAPLEGNTASGQVMDLSIVDPPDFEPRIGYLFNTFLGLGYCPECVEVWLFETAQSRAGADLYIPLTAQHVYANDLVYAVSPAWLAVFAICAVVLFLGGVAGVVVESMTVAPDILGYVSTVARNSRYLQLPKTSSAMSGGERAKTVGGVKVMMQDVKGNAEVGKIALGLKHEKAKRLVPGRLYR